MEVSRTSYRLCFRAPCPLYRHSKRSHQNARSLPSTCGSSSSRPFSTSQSHRADVSEHGPINAAPELPLVDAESPRTSNIDQTNIQKFRVVPASPSYFTTRPRYTDDLLHLQTVLRKYQTLPLCKPGEAPRRAWPVLDQYRTMVGGEQVQATRFARMVEVLRRLNYIHPQIIPEEVEQTLERFSKKIDLSANRPKPILIDEFGRAKAVGRRKSSSAQVWLVEGDGGVLVNGKTIAKAFPRVHDRESVVWALKATDRLNKYNIWALASGGGTTGQAEAITLGVGKALLAHEPDLKTQLRRGKFVLKSNQDVDLPDAFWLIDFRGAAGCVARDPRRVERKKPGRVKARKMPTWVKR